MTEKFTIKKKNLKGEDNHKILSLRLKKQTLYSLDIICKETNYSRNKLINLLLEFGLENTEVIEK